MTKIFLTNTLSGKKEEFKPVKAGQLSMYNCGPTVYDRAHIGNLRAYVMADTIRRTFEYSGYEVRQVINITDVGHLVSDSDEGEDKMTKALKREGLPMTLEAMYQVATRYFEAFKADLQTLNIEMPAQFPRASEFIAEDIELIKTLDSKGVTYQISDGVYFDTSKFEHYGMLGNINIEALKANAQARVGNNSGKKNLTDFALWKFDAKLGWESPWGRGFPGWHIECSAMSVKFLGQPFDIHTGAIDLIPVHHNNEIAQSESACGMPLANFWLHNAFVNIKDGKMAKSAGNFITLETLQAEKIHPLAYRYWLLTAHYRSPIEFSYEAVRGAQSAYQRLSSTVANFPVGGSINSAYQQKFVTAISDDLNTPQAVALIWDLMKDDAIGDADKKATILDFDRVLGLNLGATTIQTADALSIPSEVISLADQREEARKAKDWTKADELRNEISKHGYDVMDKDGGYNLNKK